MYSCAALIVKNTSKQLLPCLTTAASLVKDVLYVPCQLADAELSETARKIDQIYLHISKINPKLDLRVVLPPNGTPCPLSNPLDVILSPELSFEETSSLPGYHMIHERSKSNLTSLFKTIEVNPSQLNHIPSPSSSSSSSFYSNNNQYSDVAVGGTFDILHNGHRLLLTHCALLATRRLLVGVADGPLLQNKTLAELIQPVSERVRNVVSLLEDIRPGLVMEVVPITDVYGPTAWDAKLNCLVVTEETAKGGDKVNEERKIKGLLPMAIVTIQLIEDGSSTPASVRSKASSSSLRKNILGKYRLPKIDRCVKDWKGGPYLVGLTGGTASGKSSIANYLTALGAHVIDCDKLGHKAYAQGTTAYQKILEEFGQSVLSENGDINRKVLGPMVFSDESKLLKLNEIVWPEIWRLAMESVQNAYQNGYKICILDAAILLKAQWNERLHEVWVTILPQEETVKRVMERDGVTQDMAKKRMQWQIPNGVAVDHGHVVFCSLWDYEFTHSQVEKAWKELNERLLLMHKNNKL